MKNLNLGIIYNLKILVPSIKLHIQFVQISKKTEALKTQYEQSMQELEMLYGSLSQKAFMGKPNLSEEEEVQLMIADIVKTCLSKIVINGN